MMIKLKVPVLLGRSWQDDDYKRKGEKKSKKSKKKKSGRGLLGIRRKKNAEKNGGESTVKTGSGSSSTETAPPRQEQHQYLGKYENRVAAVRDNHECFGCFVKRVVNGGIDRNGIVTIKRVRSNNKRNITQSLPLTSDVSGMIVIASAGTATTEAETLSYATSFDDDTALSSSKADTTTTPTTPKIRSTPKVITNLIRNYNKEKRRTYAITTEHNFCAEFYLIFVIYICYWYISLWM